MKDRDSFTDTQCEKHSKDFLELNFNKLIKRDIKVQMKLPNKMISASRRFMRNITTF